MNIIPFEYIYGKQAFVLRYGLFKKNKILYMYIKSLEFIAINVEINVKMSFFFFYFWITHKLMTGKCHIYF